MFELELSRCPICQTTRRLVRQMREVQGQHFIWYECPECSSALMWLGGDRWVYQQVGRTDRQYLAKRPLTTVELQALSVADAPVTAAPAWSRDEPVTATPAWSRDEPVAATPAWSRDEPVTATSAWSRDEPVPPDDTLFEAEEMTPIPAPAATTTSITERPKGIPMRLVIAVAIITLLCVAAAIVIIVTQI